MGCQRILFHLLFQARNSDAFDQRFSLGKRGRGGGQMEGKKKKRKEKNPKKLLCPLHDADLEVGGKWKKSSRGKGTESCHLPKSQNTKCQKAGLGNPLSLLVSFFGSQCRLLKKRFKQQDLIGLFQRVDQQI